MLKWKIKIPIDMRKWTKKEEKILEREYPKTGKRACMKLLNRSESSIRKKASVLKLKQNRNSLFFKDWQRRAAQSKIGKKRPEQSLIIKKTIKEGKLFNKKHNDKLRDRMKDWWKIHKHPKGMLEKKQTNKCKKAVSESSKKRWENPNFCLNSKEYRQIMSDRGREMMNERIKNKGSIYSRANNGWYKIKKKKYYFRSSWEVLYARYLEFLKDNQNIEKWEYEKDIFWFEKIKTGVRCYTPDFKVFLKDNIIEYHEVKGWMDNKSKTKINRMRIYHPKIKLLIIDNPIIKDLKKYERMYPEAKKIKKK